MINPLAAADALRNWRRVERGVLMVLMVLVVRVFLASDFMVIPYTLALAADFAAAGLAAAGLAPAPAAVLIAARTRL